MRESAQHLGFSFSTYRVIGAVEALGAIGSHLRVRDSITGWAPALVLAMLAIIYAALLTAPRAA